MISLNAHLASDDIFKHRHMTLEHYLNGILKPIYLKIWSFKNVNVYLTKSEFEYIEQ